MRQNTSSSQGASYLLVYTSLLESSTSMPASVERQMLSSGHTLKPMIPTITNAARTPTSKSIHIIAHTIMEVGKHYDRGMTTTHHGVLCGDTKLRIVWRQSRWLCGKTCRQRCPLHEMSVSGMRNGWTWTTDRRHKRCWKAYACFRLARTTRHERVDALHDAQEQAVPS